MVIKWLRMKMRNEEGEIACRVAWICDGTANIGRSSPAERTRDDMIRYNPPDRYPHPESEHRHYLGNDRGSFSAGCSD